MVWGRGEATNGERRLHAIDVAKLVRMVAELLQVGRQHLVLVGHVHAYVLVGRRDVRQIVVLFGRATKSLCKARGLGLRNNAMRDGVLTYVLLVHFLMVFVVVAVIHLNLLMFHF